MTGLPFTCKTIPVCTNVRKPVSAASNRYGPSARFDNTYDPVSFVTAVRTTAVSIYVAVTSTPGSTAPVWSRTVPLSCAVACAHAELQLKIETNNAIKKSCFIRSICLPTSGFQQVKLVSWFCLYSFVRAFAIIRSVYHSDLCGMTKTQMSLDRNWRNCRIH